MDGVDVVIPVRNEEDRIGVIASTFKVHPAINNVIVMVDADTADETVPIAVEAADIVATPPLVRGKGQLCHIAVRDYVKTDYVLFCDGDLDGLTHDHISLLIGDAITDAPFMTIGVPDIPTNYPTERIWAWPWVSGERCIPTRLIKPLRMHGYLMETQINQAASHANMGVHFEWLTGLKSSYYMSERRIHEMMRDADFGRQHGIL